MGDSCHQLAAQGSLESVWLLPLSTPVTSHMLPLEHPPRSSWEWVPLCSEYLPMAFQKGQLTACAYLRWAADCLKVTVRLFLIYLHIKQ